MNGATGQADGGIAALRAGQMAGQMAGLGLLLAEMQALSCMMPGLAAGPHPRLADAAARQAEEDAQEAAFDNMPV